MKRIYRLLTIILFATVATFQTVAIQNTRLFNSKEIVSSNYSSFCLDSYGYLWIGTQHGLLRFDGTNFDRYLYDEDSETSLSDNRVLKILHDKNNRMWVATCDGLNLYNPQTDDFQRISLPNLNFKGYIIDILQRSNGDILFMASGVGLFIIDFSSGSPVAVNYIPDATALAVNRLGEIGNGTLIFGNHDGNVFKVLPNGQIKKFDLTKTYIQIIQNDGEGGLLIASINKAWRWNPKTDVFSPIKIPANISPTLNCAILTNNGNILVGTTDNGLFCLEKNSLELKPYRELKNPIIDLDRTRISTIHEDLLGNLWLGCSHHGIVMAPKREIPFNFIDLSRTVSDYYCGPTNVATIPGSDNIWIGLDDGRLISIDESGNQISKHRFNAGIGSLKASKSGKLYIGVNNNGLYELSPSDGSIRQLFKISSNYIASAIAEDPDGNIYFGAQGEGIVRINPQTDESHWLYENDTERAFRWVSTIYCDSKSRVWVGMYGALSLYNPSTKAISYLSLNHPQMIKCVHNSIAEDSAGNIWDATSNGLFIINPDDLSFNRLTPKEGLSDILVSTILFDKTGNAWAGTHNGINRIDPNLNIIPFSGKNDIADSDYYHAVAMPDDSRLLFCGEKGLTILEPDKLNKPLEQDIFISKIHLNGKGVNSTTLTASGEKVMPDSTVDNLRLSYRDNSLVFQMSVRDFHETDNIIFQWRIPEIVDDWVSTTPGSDTIALPHLQSGDYLLEIRASENGQFSNITTVNISVSSPWYLTPIAKLLYALLLCSIAALAWRVLQNKNTDRINEEKIKFFINVSHEIRSPLTLILTPIEQLIKKETDAERLKKLKAIHRNANRILGLINQLLDIRKIDKGKMPINCTDVELTGFTNELVDIFKPQAEDKKIKLSFENKTFDLSTVNVWIDRNNFDKILVNLISNAIKYTPEGGEIVVSVSQGNDNDMGDYAEITVSDTGIGLDEKNIHHIFDRFYQGKFNNGNIPLGFGIGLDLCRMLVRLHNGTITAANRTDCRGSIFTVRIPTHKPDEHNATETPPNANEALIISTPGEHRQVANLTPTSSNLSTTLTAIKKRRNNTSIKILVVDDDAEIRSFLSDTLSGIGKVTEAINGEAALRSIVDSKPDLIISDVVMPVVDGLTLLKTLKTNIDTNHIPVILLSSKNDIADRMAGWDKGADSYIGKPFCVEELLSLVYKSH